MGIDLAEQPRLENLAVDEPVSVLPSPGSRFPVDAVVAGDVNGGAGLVVKRKRGRPPKNGGRAAFPPPAAKKIKEEEDVCFICFDGGSLVLCDRRDCPKAYHPACVRRDESFFNERVKWNCGWHLCNSCQRNALFMCYMCPYSLCKTCVKQADISCVRGNKGFCKTCMATVSLIENIPQGNDKVVKVDFDDTTSWEYLFKVYWVYLKQKESLTLDELKQATNPWKSPMLNPVNSSPGENHNTCVNSAAEFNGTVDLSGPHNNQVDTNVSKRRKTRKQPPLHSSSRERLFADKPQEAVRDWASQELLEFVAHVKNGDASKLTQFDVQALLLEYIRKNKLRDPHRKCQIICDKRLEILFGKELVGHFEMLKLLEYHFRDGSCSSGVVQAAAANSCASQMKAEECAEEVHVVARERKQQAHKNDRQINLDKYAAIDAHNMNLIYLRRGLMENLVENAQKFHDKAVGSIVRIRISGNDQKQEIYRLVRVVGTSKAAEPYTIGDEKTHIMLKILNLDKIEDVTLDATSNQDFSEDECRRLRQSIKCGLTERMTVGEVYEKAIALQEVRIKDVLEAEILKLNHLRDRASEMGHRKELKECVEKLELLKSPEEHRRRMREMPEVHADPRMDPSYQSDEDSEQSDAKQDGNMTPVHASGTPRSKDRIDPQSGDIPCGARAKFPQNSRTTPVRSQANKEEDASRSHESSQSLLDTDAARILEELRNQVDPRNNDATLANHPPDASDASVTSSSQLALSPEDAELERIWHYQDPAGKVQGPFCMLQLRKWNSSGYFPVDLRIWRVDESQDKSLLLTDALSNQLHQVHSDSTQPQETSLVHGRHQGININAAWTDGEPNDGCNPDMTNAAKCSDVENIGQEPDLNNGPKLFPEENQESSSTRPAPIDTVFATMDQNHEPPRSDLPSPTPRAENPGSDLLNSPNKAQLDREAVAKSQAEEIKVSVVHSQPVPSFILEHLPSQTPDLNNEEPKSQVTEAKEPVPSFFPEPHPNTSWPALSSEIGFHIPLSSENQNNQGIVWHDGPIELSTLGDESVSDLLSEVEALESIHGVVSPNSRIDFGDDSIDLPTNDCFGRFVGLTSACDLQFHSQPTLAEPPQPPPPPPPQPPYSVKPDFASAPQDFLSLTCASLQMHSPPTSLSLSNLSPLSAPPAGRVVDAPLPPPPPPPPPPDRSSPAEEGELEPTGLSLELSVQAPAAHSPKHPFPRAKHALETSPPSYNPGSTRPSWAASQGTALTLSGQIDQWNRMSQQSVYNGGGGRHSGQRERSHHHNVDPGIVKGGRPSWQRQPSFGGSAGGGGSAVVQGHRGQRVCKFYESGYCKKGASCKYLHP